MLQSSPSQIFVGTLITPLQSWLIENFQNDFLLFICYPISWGIPALKITENSQYNIYRNTFLVKLYNLHLIESTFQHVSFKNFLQVSERMFFGTVLDGCFCGICHSIFVKFYGTFRGSYSKHLNVFPLNSVFFNCQTLSKEA